MRRFTGHLFLWLIILSLSLTGCGRQEERQITVTPTLTAPPPTTEPATPEQEESPAVTEEPEGDGTPLYLSIIWHQHQPVYFKDPESNLYLKPWVRLHAAKDYVDMAAILQEYPELRATYNLTPSLLRQLEDLESGTRDLYWLHTELPAEELTEEQKEFIRTRFFDINPGIIARFPRYQELADQRESGEQWEAQDYRDLQVLFNLGWTDPAFLSSGPLAALVEKGRDFAEEDKVMVLEEHARLIAEVIPLHRRLQEEGQIEITTTPFFHPILPLLMDSNLARVAVPDARLPSQFAYPVDAVAQVEMGVDYYTETFGRAPRGMWPAEGAVAQEIVGVVARGGLEWIASDEEVLARSLGMNGFTRDADERVQEAATLYRPYIVQRRPNERLFIFFRDKSISDKVGFTYSGMDGEEAGEDFIRRLLAIREELAASGEEGPFLVSVILDGENAWEHYPNDGKEFLHTMYRRLQEEQEKGTIRTITPSAFTDRFPEQPRLETLWQGSWVSPDYLTWIGEEEENRAWEYLRRVRADVEERKRRLDEETLAAVMDQLYTAEGSDWFWWFGADQNSGDDGSFDLQFRRTLQRVYELMGEEPPTFLSIPVIPQESQPPAAGATALISPTIDGSVTEEEWAGAGYYIEEGGVQANPEQIVSQLFYGFDAQTLYLRLDARRPWAGIGDESRVGFYLTRPGGGPDYPFSRIGGEQTLLGFNANALVEVTIRDGSATAILYEVTEEESFTEVSELEVAVSGSTIELALPYEIFGKPDAGDTLRVRTVVSEGEVRDIQAVPSAGPGEIIVPDLGLTTPILTIEDPEGDDRGSGSYVYPSEPIFKPGAYDLAQFSVAEDENNLTFRFTFHGPLNNEWGAPNGMGIHTLDVYIDTGDGGARKLLPGRNASVPEGSGWELAIWAEGWTPGIYGPPAADSPSPTELAGGELLNISSDPAQNRITIRVAKRDLARLLGIDAVDAASWRYLAVVMGQEGFPSSGVWRVRDVEPRAAQWRFGGAPANSTTHTRIIDVAYPEDFTPSQEAALGGFTPQQVEGSAFDALSPDDFAQLPLVPAE